MPAGERERAILERLQVVCATPTSMRRSTGANGTRPAFIPIQLRSLEDFETKVPVVTKKDLRDAQARVPPFGDYLCVAGRARSSTSTAPAARPAGRRPSPSAATTGDAIANAHARIMWGMGMRPGDTVFIAAIFSLYMG